MNFVENVIDTAEDTILEALYNEFPEKQVDEFLKNYNDEIITPEISSLIDDLEALILERFNELQDEINNQNEYEESEY